MPGMPCKSATELLVPVDAWLASEADVDFETISATGAAARKVTEKKTSLVFLDACRDNPLAKIWRAAWARDPPPLGRA
jgi:uncharacterized caspase-like protein